MIIAIPFTVSAFSLGSNDLLEDFKLRTPAIWSGADIICPNPTNPDVCHLLQVIWSTMVLKCDAVAIYCLRYHLYDR